MSWQFLLQNFTSTFSNITKFSVHHFLKSLLSIAAGLETELSKIIVLDHITTLGVSVLNKCSLFNDEFLKWGDITDSNRHTMLGDPPC